VNAAGESANSGQVSATPQVAPPPGDFTLTASTGSKSRQIKLTWTKSSGATSYDVKRAIAAGGPYTTVKTGVTTTSYTDSGLTRGKIYYYVITARNAGGQRDSKQRDHVYCIIFHRVTRSDGGRSGRATSAPPLSSSFCRGFIGWRF
jgi:fibronectin type 3 domain-containing protein